jgi:MFS family permease
MGFVRVHLIPYVRDRGFSHLINASADFAMAFLGIAGALLAGGLSDRWGRRRPMSVTFAARGAAYIGLMALALWPTPFVLYTAITFMGCRGVPPFHSSRPPVPSRHFFAGVYAGIRYLIRCL